MKFLILPHHADGVYVRADRGVKARTAVAAVAAAVIPLLAGCASFAASIRLNGHVVAVSYNVELVRMLSGPQAAPEFGEDFERLGKLGFDTVVLRHAEDADRSILAAALREHGLRAADDASSQQSSEKDGAAVRLCASATRADGPQIDRVWRLDCRRPIAQDVADAGVGWLRQFHQALGEGLTGGILVEGFRAVPGRQRSLVEGEQGDGYRTATALRRVTARARAWGPRLCGLTPAKVRPINHVTDRLEVVTFVGPHSRYVLLANKSADEFIRGTAELPVDIGKGPVHRAVSVPVDPSRIAGSVVEARGTQLPVEFDLGPGDAALWELF